MLDWSKECNIACPTHPNVHTDLKARHTQCVAWHTRSAQTAGEFESHPGQLFFVLSRVIVLLATEASLLFISQDSQGFSVVESPVGESRLSHMCKIVLVISQ